MKPNGLVAFMTDLALHLLVAGAVAFMVVAVLRVVRPMGPSSAIPAPGSPGRVWVRDLGMRLDRRLICTTRLAWGEVR